MQKTLKKSISILLSIMMIVSVFTIVPISASAAEETSTVTWDNNSLQRSSGGKSSGGVTLTTQQGNTRVNDCFYDGRGSATFTAPEGSVFTKIELKNSEYVTSLNFPGATVAESGGYWDPFEPEDPYWIPYYTVTWTGESSEVTFSGAVYSIQSIVFTLKSVAPTTYTVTWKNGDTVLETDTNVAEGTTPTYDGETPVRPADANNTYTFAAWDDGKTTYVLGADDLPPVTGDVTYTAVFTATPKLFTGHSVTLGGDIGVNFFLNSAVLNAYTGTKTVKFTCDGEETTVAVPANATDYGYMVTCNVVAARMAHKIHAVVYVDGTALDQTDDYSVQDYAKAVIAEPGKYLPADDAEKAPALQALAAAMLHYGGEAQTVFAASLNDATPARADSNLDAPDYSGVTVDAVADAINGDASDLNDVAAEFGAEFYTSSSVYLSRNTLRLYFTPASKTVGGLDNVEGFTDNLKKYYYYADKENIAAAELDNQQEFTVGGVNFKFSTLDYVIAVLNSSKMTDVQKNLAKSLFLYNQAANAFFDEPAPAPTWNTVDLSTLTADYEAQNYDLLTGELGDDYQITIAAGATVTLKDANITLTESAYFAGITPLGDATILLEGENTVKGGDEDYPGIFVPENTTLTIDGTGSLTASSGGDEDRYGCGIGGGFNMAAGNIVINGATITANGGDWAAGIGSGDSVSCGNITINGGKITANGGEYAAGIGSGNSDSASCGNITITGGTITANGGEYAAGIGSGYDEATCSNILITGGTITANGGQNSAGIGSGAYSASCGNIMIADTVTLVTATKSKNAPNSIGAGRSGSCGTVTIGGVEGAITDSPYTYKP